MKAPVRRWPGRIARTFKVFAVLTLVLFVWTGWWVSANRERLAVFPEMMPGFTAREMCNCIFVTGQSEDFCRAFARQLRPPEWIAVDREARTVEASWLGRTAVSRYENERYGCSIPRFEKDPPEV